MKLFVENKTAPDGSEHLLLVGEFKAFAEMALAAYVHMNGPQAEAEGPSRDELATMAGAIERVTTDDNPIFRGISEDGEPYSFFVEFDR
ncbi:MAG: hypothetical protein M3Y23_03525 [Actinomycetota bacterium]|nr:hypothetical protein [Actinomycetota bacterium]